MNGFLCLNKPQDITSFFAVAKARRICGEKKAGHSGTLDPMATGVLVIALGKATRLLSLLPDHEKQYRATFRLGVTTDTLDRTGTVLTEQSVSVGRADVAAALEPFCGTIEQIPPMYSALQKDGVRLYTLARQGISVEREARTVTIDRLALVGANEEQNEYTIDVACSKGTYIRTLIADIGEALGTGAVMTALCRTMANGCPLTQCVTLDALAAHKAAGTLSDVILPADALLTYDKITVTAPQATRFSNGGALALDRLRDAAGDGLRCVYAPDGAFIGVGSIDPAAGELRVKKVL